MVNYTYVRLSSDIHSGSDITRSGTDIQSLLIQYPFGFRFGFFGSDSGVASDIG